MKMIIQCKGCSAKYFLSDEKVPAKPLRVRCPKCGAVFKLKPLSETRNNVIGAQRANVVASMKSSSDKVTEEAKRSAAVSVEERPSHPGAKQSSGNSKDKRARRLARVLVSDILYYNKEKRDQALIDGDLMAVLGDEIKKSWELYKEKVTAEVAGSTNYFKEALNEILADGQKIF
jgi:predicted Zn finger-like uncharacterized protein